MERNVLDLVEVDEPELLIHLLKSQISLILSNTYNKLNNMANNREVMEDIEEFDIITKIMMLRLIREVKDVKYNIFNDVLDIYNDLIVAKNRFAVQAKKENIESEEMQKYLNGSMKRTVVISAGLSLLLPEIIPLVLVIGIPKLGTDNLAYKYHQQRIEDNNYIQEIFERAQKPLYEFTSYLRRDYHSSKEELKLLEERAMNGETIIEELKEIINPNNMGLKQTKLVEGPKILIK